MAEFIKDGKIKQLSDELKIKEERIASLENQILQLIKEGNVLKADNKEMTTTNGQLATKLHESGETNNTQRNHISRLTATVDAFKRANTQLENKITELSDECDKLRKKNTTPVKKTSNPSLVNSQTTAHPAAHPTVYYPPSIDPRTGFYALPNDAILTMEYGARAYVTDAFPGYIWRNGYWYKITPSINFTQMSDASIYSRLSKKDHDGPIQFTGSKINTLPGAATTHALMINDAFDAILVDGIRLFARRMVYTSTASKSITGIEPKPGTSVKEVSDQYHDFYVPATGKFQDGCTDSEHSDQVTLEHSYIGKKFFSELDVDPVSSWRLFDSAPGKSCVYQVDPHNSHDARGRRIPITDEQKTEIHRRGLLYIKDIVTQIE